jgi:hypothetical protein
MGFSCHFSSLAYNWTFICGFGIRRYSCPERARVVTGALFDTLAVFCLLSRSRIYAIVLAVDVVALN